MSGRPGTGGGPPISNPTPSNSNEGAVFQSAGVSVAPVVQSHPTVTIPQLPVVTSPTTTTTTTAMDTTQQTPPNAALTIPPLMGIQPNVSSLPIPSPSHSTPQPNPSPTKPVAILPTTTTATPVVAPVTPSEQLKVSTSHSPLTPQMAGGGQLRGASGKQMKSKDGGADSNGIQQQQPKLPILRLKKTGGPGGEEDSFEKQDSSKNDSYCWVCHDGGDVLCCDKCPRVFHLQCSGLQRPPDDEEGTEWFCSICKNIARKTKRSRPPNLKEVLLLAVERMMFPGTEIFQAPVPPDIMTHYREYIFFPMHLRKIKEKVAGGLYHSTREFTHDTEWILHNCIIYNGAKHALTKIAKNIVKVCKEDMREIELCPGCYMLTVKQPKDWFCIPCNPPHPVVLAKIRGYPLWPAKLISETSDKCDVRFFGQHDRSLVPKCDISVLNGLPPKPNTKTKHWNQAMFELKKYGENIESMRDKLGGGVIKDKSLKMLMLKDKVGKSPLGTNLQNHDLTNQQQKQQHGQFQRNMVPPPVVEVNPSDGGDGSMAISDAEVSSPGSPPGLQIDLDGSGGGSNNIGSMDKSPSKGRAMPGGRSLIGAINRNSQVPGSLDFNGETGPQAVVMASPSSGGSKVKRKGLKAGDTLSALVSSLAQRKRQSGVLAPVHQGTMAGGGGMGLSPGLDEDEADKKGTEGEGQDKTDSPFSSIYEHRNKTAIALVDPNGKRPKRKTAKVGGSEPPPAKKARTIPVNTGAPPTTTSTTITSGTGKPSEGETHPISDTAAYVAKIQEYSNAVINTLSNSVSNSTPTATQVTSKIEVPSPNVRSAKSSPQNISGSSNSSAGGGGGPPAMVLPGIPKARSGATASGGGGAKKKNSNKKMIEKNRGKSPFKGGGGGGGGAMKAGGGAGVLNRNVVTTGGSKANTFKTNSPKVNHPQKANVPKASGGNNIGGGGGNNIGGGSGSNIGGGGGSNIGGGSGGGGSNIGGGSGGGGSNIGGGDGGGGSNIGGGDGNGAANVGLNSISAAAFSLASLSNSLTTLTNALTTTSSSSSSSFPTSRNNMAAINQAPQSSALGRSISSGSSEIRGEVAAPGMPSEEMSDFTEGSGLLADTIRKVNSSFFVRLNQMTGSSDDMGYKYFVEKLMASIKTVLMEMLSTFDAKSRLSGKQLKEQLHHCWPVSNSSIAIEQLGKELRDEMKQSLEVVRASAALELEQVVNEVRRQVEKEKEIAIMDTKKKKWCSQCWKEAQYNCCWNANYCNELCQQSHWPDHMDNCTQVQQLAGPQTPVAPQMSVGTPIQKLGPGSQLSPSLAVGSVPNGVGVAGSEVVAGQGGGGGGGAGQDPHQQHSFMYSSSAASAASVAQAQAQAQQAQSQAYAQAQAQAQAIQAQAQAQMIHLQQQQQQQSRVGGGAGGGAPPPPPPAPPGRMSPMGLNGTPTGQPPSVPSSLSSSGGGGGGGGGGQIPSSHQLHPSHHHLRGAPGLRHDQHHGGGGGRGSPLLHVDNLHPMDTMPSPSQIPMATSIEKPGGGHMEHLPGDGMITTANTASPPNHIRNMLLSQHHQQSSGGGKGGVISGGNPILMGHQSPVPSNHGMHTPPMGGGGGGGGDIHPNLSSRSEHSHSSNSSNTLYAQTTMSPVTPPSENPSSVPTNYGGWPYSHPQHAVIIGNDSYPGMPLLPAMQASTPTTQHNFFKAAY